MNDFDLYLTKFIKKEIILKKDEFLTTNDIFTDFRNFLFNLDTPIYIQMSNKKEIIDKFIEKIGIKPVLISEVMKYGWYHLSIRRLIGKKRRMKLKNLIKFILGCIIEKNDKKSINLNELNIIVQKYIKYISGSNRNMTEIDKKIHFILKINRKVQKIDGFNIIEDGNDELLDNIIYEKYEKLDKNKYNFDKIQKKMKKFNLFSYKN